MVQVDSRTGRIVSVNKKFCDIVGYSREEMATRTWQDITSSRRLAGRPGRSPRGQGGDEQLLEGEALPSPGRVDGVGTLDGIPPAGSGAGARFPGRVVEDITREASGEESLPERGALPRPDREVDGHHRRARRRRALSVLEPERDRGAGLDRRGVAREERLRVHPPRRPGARHGGLQAALARPTARPLASCCATVTRTGPGARSRPTRATCSSDPAVRGVVVNSRDVTEQRPLEEQLQQSQKLESVGRLAGGVAHDFNNLLTVILSCAEALKEDVGAGSPARAGGDRRDPRRRASAPRELTRQLLAFARKQVIAPVPLDLNARGARDREAAAARPGRGRRAAS